ncbi:MAG: BamA/TamA family outer membrane protein, partial [Balneolaceae bacterium]
KATRLTNTPNWSEKNPQVTRDNRLVFISDKNGIQNIYELNLETRTSVALTNLQTGASQISISSDGSRLAFNSINEGYLDIFMLRTPFQRAKQEEPTANYWAQRRSAESQAARVPATLYAREMFDSGLDFSSKGLTVEELVEEEEQTEREEEEAASGNIDFRNYVFSEEVIEDTTLQLRDIANFSPENTITQDGRYQPKKYRLKFSTDIAYNPTFVASTYGSYALTQFIISDLLGDHQISLGTNFVTDLRNSDYSLQYGYFKNRTNFFASYFHTSRRYQTYYGEIIRYRTYGGGFNVQYPFDKFRRIDIGISALGVTRDYSSVSDAFRGASVREEEQENDKSAFLYPEIIYTSDHTLPGFLTPSGGSRYSIGISASPGVGENAPQFASVLGDFRKYFGLGNQYSFAFRASGATSIGRDAQTYFMGGQLGWINQRFSDNGLSFDRLTDSFFTVPALPVRGYAYNSIYGSNFSLINAEFRFPLFAAIVPGPLPILPFYNLTGTAFIDVGTAWGQTIEYGLLDSNQEPIINDKKLDFKVAKERFSSFASTPDGPVGFEAPYLDGDILIGAGFGLRTIVFGLPLRYDAGWPYDRDGFKGKPIHYFSIGIDF